MLVGFSVRLRGPAIVVFENGAVIVAATASVLLYCCEWLTRSWKSTSLS